MATKNALAMMVLVCASMTSIGCAGSAQVVRRGSFSGELAMSGSVTERMYAAQRTMLDHCEGRARIIGGEEASRLAAIDPEIAKAREASATIEGERLHYVCVTHEAAVR